MRQTKSGRHAAHKENKVAEAIYVILHDRNVAGPLLDYFPAGEPGHYTDFGHRLALGGAMGLQALGLLWSMCFRERADTQAGAARA